MDHFEALLDRRIAVVEAPVTGKAPDLFAAETRSVVRAVSRRRLEFATGRDCARKAMAALGHPKVALPAGPDRVPLWPDGLVGSITHTDTWAAAAVARRDQGFVAIGIDLEPADALPEELWSTISAPEERARAAAAGGMAPGLAARLLFCTKEAAFKCQYPISGAMLEFNDLEIDVDVRSGTFSAVFLRAAPPFDARDRLFGRFAVSAGHMASAAVVTSEDMP